MKSNEVKGESKTKAVAKKHSQNIVNQDPTDWKTILNHFTHP